MSVNVFAGYLRGVQKTTLIEGEGFDALSLIDATAITINRIRLTFSTDLDFTVRTLEMPVVCDPRSYRVTKVSDASEQYIVRVFRYGVRQVDLIVQNQSAVQYKVEILGALESTTGVEISTGPTATYYGATPVTPTGSKVYTFYGLEAGLQAKEQQTYPPDLVAWPASPNPNVTDPRYPIYWRSEDPDSASSVVLIRLEGVDVVVNNILQPEFYGTVVENGQGGWDVSVNALTDMWPGLTRLTWQTVHADLFNVSYHTGWFDKNVSLPYAIPAEEREALINSSFDFPFRFSPIGDVLRSRDEKSIEDNMRTSIMVKAGGIPLFARFGSRIPEIPFDPNDQATQELVSLEILNAVRFGEPRVVVSDRAQVVTDDSGDALGIVVPYTYRSTLKGWKDLRLEEPEFRTVDKGNPKKV